MPKNIVYLSTGSNIGNRKMHLDNAQFHISEQIGEVVKASKIYESEAWGKENQRGFFNQVLKLKTNLNAIETLTASSNIEKEMGRVREEKWAERKIDIDILFFNDAIVNEEELVIPHIHIQDRNFVLVPFLEIDPDFSHPTLKKTIRQLYYECSDKLKVYIN